MHITEVANHLTESGNLVFVQGTWPLASKSLRVWRSSAAVPQPWQRLPLRNANKTSKTQLHGIMQARMKTHSSAWQLKSLNPDCSAQNSCGMWHRGACRPTLPSRPRDGPLRQEQQESTQVVAFSKSLRPPAIGVPSGSGHPSSTSVGHLVQT